MVRRDGVADGRASRADAGRCQAAAARRGCGHGDLVVLEAAQAAGVAVQFHPVAQVRAERGAEEHEPGPLDLQLREGAGGRRVTYARLVVEVIDRLVVVIVELDAPAEAQL